MTDPNKNTGRPFQRAGEKLDDVLGDTAKRVEQETKELIAYINDELVPAIRQHSTKALRVASEKLNQAAELMEEHNKKTKG